MPFFKLTDTTVQPNKAEVKHSDFEKYYPAVNTSMKWNTIEPFIKHAEEIYIKPVLGSAFFDELQGQFKTDQIADTSGDVWQNQDGLNWIAPDGQTWNLGGSGVKGEVFGLLRTASAYYTVYHALPHINIRIGDAGTQETNTDAALPVRQWVFNSTRKECCFAAYIYLDKALTIIKNEIDNGSTEFDTFKNSTAWTDCKELLIDSATEFNRFFNIKSSFKAYINLIPYIRKAERLYLEPLLGETFVDELRTAFRANTLTAAQSALIEKIKPYIAEATILESTPELNLINEGNGWMIVESTDGIITNKTAHQTMLDMLRAKANTNKAAYKMRLESYLYQNIDSFATFKASNYNKDINYDADAYDKNDDPAWIDGAIMM
jgi:hypothetical protein